MRYLVSFVVFVFLVGAQVSAQPQAKKGAASKGSSHSNQVCGKHGSFTATCNPFGSNSKAHAVDQSCGLTGDAASDGDKAQDTQKNNLCATGTPRVVTIADLQALQKSVDLSGVDYGNEDEHHQGPPANRADLFTKLPSGSPKEGDLVSFVGFIVEAKPGSSETVNCHCGPNPLSIDVHMALADHQMNLAGATKDADLCTNSFVSETIPHLRPAYLELTAVQPIVGKKIVKITGPLLFDGSHRPCQGTQRGSSDPARLTVWEIHPVYKIEVCTKTTLDQCAADSANWQPVGNAATSPAHKGGKKK
jgi:hypothetical protein